MAVICFIFHSKDGKEHSFCYSWQRWKITFFSVIQNGCPHIMKQEIESLHAPRILRYWFRVRCMQNSLRMVPVHWLCYGVQYSYALSSSPTLYIPTHIGGWNFFLSFVYVLFKFMPTCLSWSCHIYFLLHWLWHIWIK